MEIILKDDIEGLGYKNDIVKVRKGYGRNFLIPKGLAIIANEANKKVQADNIRQAAHIVEKIKNDALTLADSMKGIVLEIPAKVGESGKIFGAVTALQIADALKLRGFDIDRKKINFQDKIKELGEYTATLDLHKEVKHEIKFRVIAD